MYRVIGSTVSMCWQREMTTVRVIGGYLFGFFIAAFFSNAYVKYVAGDGIGAGDGFLLLLTPFLQMSFVLLGYFMIIADIPLVNSLTFFIVIRCGRKKWIGSVFLYLVLQTLMYYFVVLIGTLLPGIRTVLWQNEWSMAMKYLSRTMPMDALEEYGIYPVAQRVLELWSPLEAVVATFTLICGYSFLLALIMLMGNLNSSIPKGTFYAVGIHFLGTLMIKIGGRGMNQFSPLSNAILERQIDESGMSTLGRAYGYFGIFVVVIVLIICRSIKKTDFLEANVERTW